MNDSAILRTSTDSRPERRPGDEPIRTSAEARTGIERAAYVLREAFGYPYGQIAGILRLTEPAVRQLISRARKHMSRRTPASAAAQRELLASFITAARCGDMTALERLFAPA